MSIETRTAHRPSPAERQDLLGDTFARQCTDFRNRLRVVPLSTLDALCDHFHLTVMAGASVADKRQILEEAFLHPEKLRYRGKMLALLNKNPSGIIQASLLAPRERDR